MTNLVSSGGIVLFAIIILGACVNLSQVVVVDLTDGGEVLDETHLFPVYHNDQGKEGDRGYCEVTRDGERLGSTDYDIDVLLGEIDGAFRVDCRYQYLQLYSDEVIDGPLEVHFANCQSPESSTCYSVNYVTEE